MEFNYEEFTKRQKYIFTKDEQEKIRRSKVGVFGVGGNGAPCAEALIRLGIGYLRIVDPDTIELSNLGAQPYNFMDIGRSKVIALSEKLKKINPLVKIDAVIDAINEKNVFKYLHGLEVVVDAMDDYRAKVALARKAKEMNIPVVHTSGVGYRGSITVFLPESGITYEDMFDLPSKNKPLDSISDEEFLKHRKKVANIICKNMFPDELINKMDKPDTPWHGIVVPCYVFGVWAALEVVKILTGKFDKVIKAPNIIKIDFMNNKIEYVYITEKNKFS